MINNTNIAMGNDSTSSGIATRLTNPGIIDRLEQDIQDYLHKFGFRISRDCNDDVDQTPSQLDRAVLFIPTLPYSYPNDADEYTTTASISNTNQSISGPVGTLHLHVQNESLLPTIGPLLRTLLRLAVHIPPQSLRAILYCDFTLDPLQKLSKMSALQQREHLGKQEEIAARKMMNAVHMLVRNSMGSALCLDMVLVMPCYWKRRDCDDDGKESVPISKFAVEQAMESNRDACYPSIHLEERIDSEIDFNSSVNDIDSVLDDGIKSSSIHLSVSTRMCTVRHQPLLFRWVSQLGSEQSMMVGDAKETVHSTLSPQLLVHDHKMPLIVACVEKPGNLHRILMLCHQYQDRDSSILSNLIVIMPDDGEHSDIKQLFQGAVDHFRETILNQDSTNDEDADDGCLPTLTYEGEAVTLIQTRLNRHTMRQDGRTASPHDPSIVGIDLHKSALTLSGSDNACQAQVALVNADVIVFGYESTGIPQIIDEILNSWIQIPSRSSINLVAAMSIILDAMFGTY